MDNSITLWQFLFDMLMQNQHRNLIRWTGRRKGEFKLIDHEAVASLWGRRKNKPNMNYDKLSRALRYYYDKDIIKKVVGEKFVYRFVKMPDTSRPVVFDNLKERHPLHQHSVEHTTGSLLNAYSAAMMNLLCQQQSPMFLPSAVTPTSLFAVAQQLPILQGSQSPDSTVNEPTITNEDIGNQTTPSPRSSTSSAFSSPPSSRKHKLSDSDQTSARPTKPRAIPPPLNLTPVHHLQTPLFQVPSPLLTPQLHQMSSPSGGQRTPLFGDGGAFAHVSPSSPRVFQFPPLSSPLPVALMSSPAPLMQNLMQSPTFLLGAAFGAALSNNGAR